MYNLCECVTNKRLIKKKIKNRLLQKDWWIDTTTYSNAGTADYVILSLDCIPLIKEFEFQNFEPVQSDKYKLACFTLVVRDERKKNEVNFETDYVSDSFMDKSTKSDVHFLNLNGTDC